MGISARYIFLACAVSGVIATMSGCGGSSGLPEGAVAQVGSTSITRAALGHWMASLVGEDYFQHVGARAPQGLVSEPPNYRTCLTAAEKMVPKLPDGRLKLTRAQLLSRCQQLYQSLKQQALSLLLSFAWRAGEGAEQGIEVSGAEVRQLLARVRAEQFPKDGQFEAYLAQRGWSLSDELAELKRSLLSTKLLAAFRRRHPSSNWPIEYGRLLEANAKKWRSRTTCRTGYVVEQCKPGTPSQAVPSSSPSVLLENLAAGR
jgi:hypothetical protein